MTSLAWLLAACSPGSRTNVATRAMDPVPVATDGAAIHVDCNGGADATTITQAIALAHEGDTILVEPCVYHETIDFAGKSLRIKAVDGSSATVIDGGGAGAVVTAQNGEGVGTALVGFTLQGGSDSTAGTVYLDLSSLTLQDDVITGSAGEHAVYSHSGDLVLDGVTFTDDAASGAMVAGFRGAVRVHDSTVGCGAGGIAVESRHGAFHIDASTLECAGGYSLSTYHSEGIVLRSVLEGSFYSYQEWDHYTDTVRIENTVIVGDVYENYGTLLLRNSIVEGGTVVLSQVYGNTTLESSVFANTGCAISADTTDFTVRYNDFWNAGCAWSDESEIAADPMFTDESGGDYQPLAGSPLIDAGVPDPAYEDPDGTRNDIGIYGGPHSVGGGW